MFKHLLLFVFLFLVLPMFAVAGLDSATTQTGVNVVGKLAEIILNLTGNSTAAQFVTLIVAAVGPILAFVFGHMHGVKNATRLLQSPPASGK